MKTTIGPFLVTCALASGCSGLVGSRAWFESETPSLTKQAAFDLGCPAPEVQLTSLSADNKTVGATGCGKRTGYLYVFEMGWSRNSEVLTN